MSPSFTDICRKSRGTGGRF